MTANLLILSSFLCTYNLPSIILQLIPDVSTAEGREVLRKEIETKFGGKLDVLVNNVGTNIRKSTAEYTEDDYELQRTDIFLVLIGYTQRRRGDDPSVFASL